jgi:hypothetical protein
LSLLELLELPEEGLVADAESVDDDDLNNSDDESENESVEEESGAKGNLEEPESESHRYFRRKRNSSFHRKTYRPRYRWSRR